MQRRLQPAESVTSAQHHQPGARQIGLGSSPLGMTSQHQQQERQQEESPHLPRQRGLQKAALP